MYLSYGEYDVRFVFFPFDTSFFHSLIKGYFFFWSLTLCASFFVPGESVSKGAHTKISDGE